MPTSLVNLSTTEYVKVNSTQSPLVLQSMRDTVRIAMSVAKPTVENTVFHTLDGSDSPLQLFDLDADVWALATSDRCSLVVTETGPAQVGLHDGFGNPIGSLDGAIDVHNADPHHVVYNQLLHYDTATTTTLAADALAGSSTIVLASAVGFAAGDELKIENGIQEPVFFLIVTLVGTTATLDTPLSIDHLTGTPVTKIYTNIAQPGVTSAASVATPVIYGSHVHTGTIVHITSMTVIITDNSAMDFTTFGGIAALANGCVLSASRVGVPGSYTNWKSNSDMDTDAFPVRYQTKVGGGLYGLSAIYNIKSSTEAIIYLAGSAGDSFQIRIQDDLTALTSFRIKLQGHYEGI